MVTTSGPANGPAGSPPASVVLSSRPASVVSTERCWHVVPFAVTTVGVASASPYSISVRAASGRCDAVACKINGPGAAASAAQSTSPRTSATVCADPSGSPAYVGTAVVSGRPGTISKFRGVFASAVTSVITASTDSGSPPTSRTTSTPVRASAASVLATSAGSPSAGRMSGPPAIAGAAPAATSKVRAGSLSAASTSVSAGLLASAGSGPDGGGSSEPARASTASGTSGSVNTRAALASTARARVVSRPGSPGPAPTNVMRPGFVLRPRVVISHSALLPTDRLAPVRTTPRPPRALAHVPDRKPRYRTPGSRRIRPAPPPSP